jgi:hydroxymethylpyrimidine/phosphomethylpyrimidine kinase
VLVKGGHLPEEDEAVDLLYDGSKTLEFRAERLDQRHTHGTGCTYSAAITAGLARGLPLIDAVRRAKTYITEAIRTAPGLGGGVGPLNHFVDVGRPL